MYVLDIFDFLGAFFKVIVILFIIGVLLYFLDISIENSYGEPIDKKAKVIEFIVDKDKDKFVTVLEVDGEIIFKDDKAFYYKVRDKLNEEIDVTVKENEFDNIDKIVELKDNSD